MLEIQAKMARAMIDLLTKINKTFFFCFLGPHPHHMEVPKLEVKLELQLPAYTTTIATQNLSHICDLYHTSW